MTQQIELEKREKERCQKVILRAPEFFTAVTSLSLYQEIFR